MLSHRRIDVMVKRMTLLVIFALFVIYPELISCGVIPCKYNIHGIEGFAGEITVKGKVYIAMSVFQINFLLEGRPITDSRPAILKNIQETEYFTITFNTNEIMATRTVPVGTSEILEVSIEGANECLFHLTVTVVSRTTTEGTTTPRGGVSSFFTLLSGSASSVSTSVIPKVCQYQIQGIDGFLGEVTVEGKVYLASIVFQIMFLLDGSPVIDFRRAVLKNLEETQYFTITVNTNHIMAKITVPVGVSEVLEIGIEGAEACTFSLTVTVVSEVAMTFVSTGELTTPTSKSMSLASSPTFASSDSTEQSYSDPVVASSLLPSSASILTGTLTTTKSDSMSSTALPTTATSDSKNDPSSSPLPSTTNSLTDKVTAAISKSISSTSSGFTSPSDSIKGSSLHQVSTLSLLPISANILNSELTIPTSESMSLTASPTTAALDSVKELNSNPGPISDPYPSSTNSLSGKMILPTESMSSTASPLIPTSDSIRESNSKYLSTSSLFPTSTIRPTDELTTPTTETMASTSSPSTSNSDSAKVFPHANHVSMSNPFSTSTNILTGKFTTPTSESISSISSPFTSSSDPTKESNLNPVSTVSLFSTSTTSTFTGDSDTSTSESLAPTSSPVTATSDSAKESSSSNPQSISHPLPISSNSLTTIAGTTLKPVMSTISTDTESISLPAGVAIPAGLKSHALSLLYCADLLLQNILLGIIVYLASSFLN